METQPDLREQVIVITGGNSGIGRMAAVDLARMGATVVITARDELKGADALDEIQRRAGTGTAEVMALDLASFVSIRSFAAELLDRFGRIDVLVNNAGAILSTRTVTDEGFESTFGVNHLGHFLLTELLVDRLTADVPSRIINVTSIAHRFSRGFSFADPQFERRRYSGTEAYNQSKVANILFTMELARRLAGTGVTANCLHPGGVRSGFGSADDTRGLERLALILARPFLIGPDRGARPIVYLASSPEVEGSTGGYYVGGLLPGVRRHEPSRAARDPDAARLLWTLSEELVASASEKR